jgi:uncharacterized membrane protein
MSWPFPQESAHPLVVHFPIALLLTAVMVDVAALALKRAGLHHIALWNLTLGTLGAALAVLTGLHAESVARHSFDIWQVMALHKRLGIATLVLGLMAASWRLAKRDCLTPRGRVATLLLAAVMVGTLAWGAHLGGRLVYEFGVGGAFGRSDHRD